MRQFKTIFSFELQKFFKNKVFLTTTAILMALALLGTTVPRIIGLFRGDSSGNGSEEGHAEGAIMLVAGLDLREPLQEAFPQYTVMPCEQGEIEPLLTSGGAVCAVYVEDLSHYTYYVDNLSIYDDNVATVEMVLRDVNRTESLTALGVPPERIQEALYPQIEGEVVPLGVNQAQNYWYTYVMIIALYMVILLYGNSVATNVAGEKSSRAMELLITSADPVAMMFGKVFAAGLAGLTQLVSILGMALLGFRLNAEAWASLSAMASFFTIPPALVGYMLLFFLLGFFLYAFLYAAMGSTVSRLEDVGNACQLITWLFVAMYMLVIFSLTSGNVDTPVMLVASFLPLTSPLAMFTRIAMSTVPLWQQLVSIGLLIASVYGAGILAAMIYRVGVLLYGTRLSLPELVKKVWQAK